MHGLSEAFLGDKPLFSEVAQDFVNYIDGGELIIHNASFDMKFLDHELKSVGLKALSGQCSVIDSLKVARDLYPGQRNNLDTLCRRLGIDNSKRTLHGALLDSEILAQVYLAMTGGQDSLFGGDEDGVSSAQQALSQIAMSPEEKLSRQTKVIKASDDELNRHNEFIAKIKS